MKYTPAQQQAIESQARYICVDAGAGSGKTRVLVDRIVNLLKTGQARLEEIVAITFTEKAALEMKERLRKAFRRMAPNDNPAEFSMWRDLERRVDTAHITTIHAFCARLLRENALFLGLDPDFGLLSDAENALLLQESVESVMIRLLEKNDPAMLRLASVHTLGELQGLCKALLRNRGVVDRIRRRGGMDTPDAVMATWQAQATAEQARYLADLGRNAQVNTLLQALKTYEGLCDDPEEGREAWRHSMVLGFEAMQAGIPAEEAEEQLRGFLKNPFGNGKKKLWPSPEIYDGLTDIQKKVTTFAKDALLDGALAGGGDVVAESAQLASDLLQLDGHINSAYEKAKEAAGLLDFDDLILFALKVLRDKDTLRQQTAKGMKYLLLDEFQDTDGQQLEIARLLHDEEAGPALFIVGDPKQSIYYFRGAEVEIFQTERATSEELVRLDCNFRSLPDVLGFVNDFFQQSNLLCAVERYQPMVIGRERIGGPRVGFILSDPPEEEDPKRWPVSEYRQREATQIAAQIAALCAPESDATVCDEHTSEMRRPEYGDVALLFRATSNVGIYEEALRKAGIPYTVVAGAGFYERQEVVDVINILKVLADPWDEIALLAYLRGPVVALSDDDLVRLCRQGTLTAMALGEMLPTGLDYPERLMRARFVYEELRARLAGPLPELVDHLLEITGLEAILLSQFLGLQKASNVRKLANLAREQARRGALTLRQFVNYLDEVHTYQIREGEAGLQPDGAGSVTLMTIHKSKGLEFPVVFVPDMAQPIKGSKEHTLQIHRQLGITLRLSGDDGNRIDTPLGALIKRRIKEEEGAESARVLYVALTRARDMLYLCGKANAPLGTWYHAFELIHGFEEATHGHRFDGDNWQAETIRNLSEVRGAAPQRNKESDGDMESVRRRIAPVTLSESATATISVSRLLNRMCSEESAAEERPDEDQPRVERDSSYAMDRGTLVHRMFEVWEFAGEELPDVARLVRDGRMGLQARERLMTDLRNIATWFAESPLGKRLATASDLEREAPFSLRIGETVVNGTIDLVLSDGTLIDYKTGKMKEKTAARYEKQLLLYAAALQTLRGVTPTRGILVYVDAGECVEVPVTPEEIDGVLAEARATLESGPDVPSH